VVEDVPGQDDRRVLGLGQGGDLIQQFEQVVLVGLRAASGRLVAQVDVVDQNKFAHAAYTGQLLRGYAARP
jgi:hypothetical protein